MDRKALIIDDQFEICQLLKLILNLSHISSVYTGTLRETREVLSTFIPDIIFIDQNLPDGLGFNEIPKIKKLLPEATIIAMTTLITPSQKVELINNGASFTLEKPFTIQQINKLVSV